MSALVTPGNLRSALAVTRSLGRQGVAVTVADERRRSLAGVSRYCRDAIQVPSAARSPEAFLRAIHQVVERGKHRVLIPTDDIALSLISDARSRFEGLTVLPFPGAEVVQLAHDKGGLMSLAEEKGIPVPRTVVVREPARPRAGRPARRLSRGGQGARLSPGGGRAMEKRGRELTTSTRAAELEAACRAVGEIIPFPLVQEYIPGDGRGVFALMNRDDSAPPSPTGGCARSRRRAASRCCRRASRWIPRCWSTPSGSSRRLKWHGVAMVEFKRDARDGVSKLLEINGRFWGSLQLSVDAGVDFPHSAVPPGDRR